MSRSGYRPNNIMDRHPAVVRTVLKVVTVLLLANAPLTGKAQENADHRYVAQIIGLLTEQHEKLLNDAMSDWEVVEQFKVSRQAHRVKFTTSRPVDEAELSTHLTGTGSHVFWLAEVQADGSLTGVTYEAHAFPVFQNTGDPAGDNARYQADKAAWLAAHPGWVDENSRSDEGTEPETEK